MSENTVLDNNVSSIIKKEGIRFKDDNDTKFPNLKKSKLGDILLIQRGGSPRPIEDYITDDENGINWIKIGDAPANGGNRIVSVKERIKPSGKSKSREVKKGDLILSNSMSFGKPYILEVDGCIHDGWLLLRDLEKRFNLSYLCELLGSPSVLLQYKRLAAGSTVNNLNKDLVASVIVSLPCLKEQEKIASFLTSIDNLLSIQEERISTFETYNRGLISKVFSQEIRFKNDNGNDYPDWKEKTLIEVCDFINGKAHENAIEENGAYIVVNSKFISSNGTIKKYSNIQITPLYKNDIVIVMSDVPNGKAIAKCYLIDCDNKYTLNQRICALRTSQNPYFIKMQINRNPYYLKFDDGVKQTNLRKEDVLKCPLLLPCLEEQEKIANFLTSLDNVLQEEKNYLEYLKTIKKGLLQQMFV